MAQDLFTTALDVLACYREGREPDPDDVLVLRLAIPREYVDLPVDLLVARVLKHGARIHHEGPTIVGVA